MARAMTEEELTNVRSDGQFSTIYAAIHNPSVVFTCQVNQTFVNSDRVLEVIYDNVVEGAYTDVIPNMTAWIGSEAGMYDLGQVRIRKDPTSDTLYVGENSEVFWDDDVWITVVDEFGLWPRHLAMDADGTPFMDADIAYTDQHTNMVPTVVMGPPAVLWLRDDTVSLTLDLSHSKCLSPGAKTYSSVAPGASGTSDMDTDAPTVTYDTPGTYRVTSEVTVAGVTGIGHRYIFVFSDDSPPAQFNLKSAGGDYSEGGWDFSGEVFAPDAAYTNLRDRAMIVLFAIDYYGQVQMSIGPIPGYENVVVWGWVVEEPWDLNPINGRVNLNVKGPNRWLDMEEGFPLGVENNTEEADAWTNFNALTTDKAVYHWVTWRTTVSQVVDVYYSDDSRQAPLLEAPVGTLWQQLVEICDPIMARPCFDRYGRMFVEINSQYLPEDERLGPDVLTITKYDWQGNITPVRKITPQTSKVDLSGISFTSGAGAIAIFSLAPGHIFGRYGRTMIIDRRLLIDQTQANTLAGLVLGNENRDFDFELLGAGNNRMLDICPQQYAPFTILPEDTPREIEFDGRLVVRTVEYTQEESKYILPRWTAEPETFPENNVDGDIIKSDGIDTIDFSVPPTPRMPVLETYPAPPIDPSVPGAPPKKVILGSASSGLVYSKNFDVLPANVIWSAMNSGLDTVSKTQIMDVVATPDGTLFLITGTNPHGPGLGRKYIYTASGLGAPWRLYYNADSFSPAEYVTGIGVNPNKQQEIAFHTCIYLDVFGTGYTGSKLNIGDSSGYSVTFWPGTGVGNVSGDDRWSCVRLAGGKWYVMTNKGGGGIHTPLIGQFSGGGTLLAHSTVNVDFGSSGVPRFGVVPGGSDQLITWDSGHPGFTIISSADLPGVYVDPGPTFNLIQGMAISPSGQYAMGQDGSGLHTSQFSTDFLATWGVPAGSMVGQDVWECFNNDFIYVFGGGTTIRLTIDQGITYEDKTGNLGSVAPLIDITNIRILG